MESSEKETDLSQGDTGAMGQETHEDEDTILSCQTLVNFMPFVGQLFVSQDAAYEFYCYFVATAPTEKTASTGE
ncbi:unnamed protein product [Linum trigynum]|uniref:Uncharacterized protein n=1 Tax=Linum trigynum TaxID=586398 RepID=A0AAV2GSD0_9ROSI